MKETTNTALAWSQIKTNSLMAYLFTQEINPFELCTICYTTLLVARCCFFKQKWIQASLVSLRGPAVEADSLAQVRGRNPARVQFAAGLPEDRSGVDFGTRFQSLPTNPAFFSRHVGSGTHWRTGEEEGKKRERRRRGETAPGLEEDIVCMCTQAQGLWPAA